MQFLELMEAVRSIITIEAKLISKRIDGIINKDYYLVYLPTGEKKRNKLEISVTKEQYYSVDIGDIDYIEFHNKMFSDKLVMNKDWLGDGVISECVTSSSITSVALPSGIGTRFRADKNTWKKTAKEINKDIKKGF